MFKNIIDDLKNQDIEVDLAQSNLILQMIDALPKEKSFIQKLKKNKTQKMGFYIWGEVGRGKTVITKCFLNHLNYKIKASHYIDLMQLIHSELNHRTGSKNPLDSIAKTLSKKYDIIFIDEFQVEDIADAMIIGNLLIQLIENNTFLYITSNAAPEDLYKDGLQRKKFLDSIKIFQESVHVHKLVGETDYRTRNILSFNKDKKKVFNDNDIKKLIKHNFLNTNFGSKQFEVNNRKFSCKAKSNNFLWISFAEFFDEPNGSKDYIEISKNYEWIFINDFINCSDDSADILRRFISFIDICYRDKTKIKFFLNDLDTDNLYSGTKLRILWNRCQSRLIEMQTNEYLI